jgi:hypothetical protein
MERMLAALSEERAIDKDARRRVWASKTHRQRAEALIARVDPERIYERDTPVLALAQVHATLALLDKQ